MSEQEFERLDKLWSAVREAAGRSAEPESTAADFGQNGMDFGDDIETARTNFNACGAEVRHAQQQLDNAYRALVGAAEQYGAALTRTTNQEVNP